MSFITKRVATLLFCALSTSALACGAAVDTEEPGPELGTVSQAVSEGDTRTESRYVGGFSYYRLVYTYIDGAWVLTSKRLCDTNSGICGGNLARPPVLQ